MTYLPEGTHILEQSRDHTVSHQGKVDWLCFWLKAAEDPDPAKAEQYARWPELRTLQDRKQGDGATKSFPH